MAKSITRLPAVRSLSEILPKGTEGGKEFARIIDLLLINEARQKGENFTAFNDASGDYQALDSFATRASGKNKKGYQYKFFPSPLSDKHRSEIRKSLNNAAEKVESSNIDHWTVVTPDDLVNSARRKDGGGDVDWFQNLAKEFPQITIEHLGHTKIQALFLLSPQLSLYYYPEIVPDGAVVRKTFEEIRRSYDTALKERSGRIEFVGMSVYKEEATKGVPLEHIYIPLTIVGEDQDDSDDLFPRKNPLDLLDPGARSVILGDPGSGKSTLLSFLALSRISDPVRARYEIEEDVRLPIVIILRRYADELKDRFHLSLLDYITEVTRAEYSLQGCTEKFFEFYLETGKAIILFDGLDELPNSNFKAVVRDRIRTFSVAYAQATVIVTSRVVGYEGAGRFPAPFGHHRMARLRLAEIENFIRDWYSVRIENPVERDANINDLVRIISNPDSSAIRDLARNPLLLTIVALVHRIDAVLPDERVVLYQKCTETLLNTWYRWKFKDEDEKSKARIERRNRRRIEAIAFWMQRRSVNADHGRAVVPASELTAFLEQHIVANERLDIDEAQDHADEFLKFVKSRTGLLIEAGDELYSFLHLTFQEYLAATHLISQGEVAGVSRIWEMVGDDFDNPRWREVVRLLVASLKNEDSQQFFIDKLLEKGGEPPSNDNSLLLSGLVLDGIEPAEISSEQIFQRVLCSALNSKTAEELRELELSFRSWMQKEESNSTVAISAYEGLQKGQNATNHRRAMVSSFLLGIPEAYIATDPDLACQLPLIGSPKSATSRLLRSQNISGKKLEEIHNNHDILGVDSPESNLYSAIMLPVMISFSSDFSWAMEFRRLLMLSLTNSAGPYRDYLFNVFSVASAFNGPTAILNGRGNFDRSPVGRGRLESMEMTIRRLLDHDEAGGQTLRRLHPAMDARERSQTGDRASRSGLSRVREAAMRRTSKLSGRGAFRTLEDVVRSDRHLGRNNIPYWLQIRSNSNATREISDFAVQEFGIRPAMLWGEVFRSKVIPELPQMMDGLISLPTQRTLLDTLRKGDRSDGVVFHIAWLILADAWTKAFEFEVGFDTNLFVEAFGHGDVAPAINIALAVRGLAVGDERWIEKLDRFLNTGTPETALLRAAQWIPDTPD